MRKYFNTFLGALFIRNGFPTIQAWISALIDWSSSPDPNNINDGHDVAHVSFFFRVFEFISMYGVIDIKNR